MTNDKLMLRKVLLTAGAVLLAVIYVIQVIAFRRPGAKDFVIDRTFDTIEISSAVNGALTLRRYGDFWKVNDEEADSDKARLISETAKQIHTLSLVSKSGGEDADERYGFTDAQRISVRVSDNGKEYLSLDVGKDAAGGQQNYVRVNGKSEIYLAGGALRQRFSVSADELRKIADAPAEPADSAPEDDAPEVAVDGAAL